MIRKSILPRSINARKRLTVREALWVYLPFSYLFAGVVFITSGFLLGVGKDLFGDIFGIALIMLGVGFMAMAGVAAFAVLDRYDNSFSHRRQRMLRDRARRNREHGRKRSWKELHNNYPQYGVEVTTQGSDMEFRVLRFDPPQGALEKRFSPWPCEQQRWDVSSEKWSVQGHTLRVTTPQTDLLVEAYCEAAEAARAMESEAYSQAAKQAALEGMALAFTPPSSKTTNAQQLEKIRKRVQTRRLLDAGDQ